MLVENAGELTNAIFRWPIMVQIVDVGEDQLSVLANIGLEGVEPVEPNTCARTIEMDGIPTSDLYVSGRVEDSTLVRTAERSASSRLTSTPPSRRMGKHRACFDATWGGRDRCAAPRLRRR